MSERDWIGDPSPTRNWCMRCGSTFVGHPMRALCRPCDDEVRAMNPGHMVPEDRCAWDDWKPARDCA